MTTVIIILLAYLCVGVAVLLEALRHGGFVNTSMLAAFMWPILLVVIILSEVAFAISDIYKYLFR